MNNKVAKMLRNLAKLQVLLQYPQGGDSEDIMQHQRKTYQHFKRMWKGFPRNDVRRTGKAVYQAANIIAGEIVAQRQQQEGEMTNG